MPTLCGCIETSSGTVLAASGHVVFLYLLATTLLKCNF